MKGASSDVGVRFLMDRLSHKFQVGQIVDFKPSRMGFPAAIKECTIMRRLPIEDGKRLYRIKCSTEAFERVVSEAQLAERAA
jgi:hypothetical protein